MLAYKVKRDFYTTKTPEEFCETLRTHINPNGFMSAWDDKRQFVGTIGLENFKFRKPYKNRSFAIQPLIVGKISRENSRSKIQISIGRTWYLDLPFFAWEMFALGIASYMLISFFKFDLSYIIIKITAPPAIVTSAIIFLDIKFWLPEKMNHIKNMLNLVEK